MTSLLRIDTSMFNGQSASRGLSDEVIDQLRVADPDLEVVVRDLGAAPLPHLDEAMFTAFATPETNRNVAQHGAVARSDALINELRSADLIVLGLPMYNFGVPSVLKAYFDHIARAGETFKYTDNGPVGLLTDRSVYVAASRGGRHLGTPLDTQTDYVRNFLAFLGLKNVEFVYAEGLAMGDALRHQGLSAAREQIGRLAA